MNRWNLATNGNWICYAACPGSREVRPSKPGVPMHHDHIPSRRRAHRARTRLLALGAAVLAGIVGLALLPAVPRPAGAATSGKPPVYAYYYLWWSASHWKSALGPNYPISANPLPLPATLDSTGCGTRTRYVGNTLTD